MAFTRAQLESFRGAVVPDLLPEPLRLLLVGINPSLWSAAVGVHFARPGNRFFPALAAAGITSHVIDASHGYPADGLAELVSGGVGISNLVRAATARADELSNAQIVAGMERIRAMVAEHHPLVVAFLGIGSYRVAFGDRKAKVGEQPVQLSWADGSTVSGAGIGAGAGSSTRVFALPNPSGLNAHETVASLGRAYRAAAVAAGVVPAA